MTITMQTVGRTLQVGLTATILASCGSNSSPASAPSVRDQIASASFTLIPVDVANAQHLTNDLLLVPLTTTVMGSVEVDADWSSAANDIQLFFYAGSCTIDIALQNRCAQVARTTSTVKPQKLTIPNLQPGTYTVSITDFGPGNESGTMTAFLIH